MIDACDRLGQKLDEVTGIVREQIEAWRQIREPAPLRPADGQALTGAAPAGSPEAEADRQTTGQPAVPENEPAKGAGVKVRDETGGESMAAVARDARRVVDTFSRSRSDWQEQADGLRQALEAIMAYLENQAANAAAKVDVAEMMSRLRDLEEQQQSLRGQINNNRMGP